ncbi:MAG: hypothetical protein R6U28_03900, partial [Cyclonatronaceae bacterium]
MTTQELFDKAYHDYMSKLDMHNMVQELTDGFEESKFRILCEEFEFYAFMAQDKWISQLSQEEIQEALDEIAKQGKEIPVLANRRSYLSEPIFKKTITIKKKQLSQSQKDSRSKFIEQMNESLKTLIDYQLLMDKFGIHFSGLYRLRRVLIEIKRENFEKKNEESQAIQPIKWLKSEEALWQLIESLKKNGLIQSRETEDIIQHFEVSGR